MLSYDVLTVIWFVLLGILISGYAILDGFDLGVGILHPLVAKTDRERRLVMNSIGPLWDGNEVWLVTFGGALFAAFPNAYSGVFSSFYTAFHLLLLCLIGRAVSLEFRSKVQSDRWRQLWDVIFFVSSLALATLFSVAIFPNLVISTVDPEYSITLTNARSSHKTLLTMLFMAGIGMPCVLSYTSIVYWIFRGKVKLDPSSY